VLPIHMIRKEGHIWVLPIHMIRMCSGKCIQCTISSEHKISASKQTVCMYEWMHTHATHTQREHMGAAKKYTQMCSLNKSRLFDHALRTVVVARLYPVDGTTTVQYRSSPTCADGQHMS
jgi:hypothetical protein